MNVRAKIGAAVAALGIIGSLTVSIIGNVLDVRIQPCPVGWTPQQCETFVPDPAWTPPVWAVFWAVFVPSTVLVASLLLELIPWPNRSRWLVVRLVGVLPVAAIAAGVSYWHLRQLLLHVRFAWLEATAGAAIIDSVMIMSTGALIALAESFKAERAPAAADVTQPTPDERGVNGAPAPTTEHDEVQPAAAEAPAPPARVEQVPTIHLVPNTSDADEDIDPAAYAVADLLRSGQPLPGIKRLKEQHRCGEPRAKRIQEQGQRLAAVPSTPREAQG